MRTAVIGLLCALLAASAPPLATEAAAASPPSSYGRMTRSSLSSSPSSGSQSRAFRPLGTAAANDAAAAEYCSRATLDISIPNVLSLTHAFSDVVSGTPLSVDCDPRSFAWNQAADMRAAGVLVDIPGGDRTASNAWVELSNGGRGYTEEAQNPTMFIDLSGVRGLRFTAGGAYMGSMDCRAVPDMDQDSAYCGYCAVGPLVVQCVDPTLGFASLPAVTVSAIADADAPSSPSACSTCVTVGAAQSCGGGGVALEWRLLPAADPSATDEVFCGPFGSPPCSSLYERWFDAFDVQIFAADGSLVLTLPAVRARADGSARLEVRRAGMTLLSADGSAAVAAGSVDDFLAAAGAAGGARQFTVRLFNPVTQRRSDASAPASYSVETVCPAASSTGGGDGGGNGPVVPPPPPPVGEFEESSTGGLPMPVPVLSSSTGGGGGSGTGTPVPPPGPPPSAGDMEEFQSTALPAPVLPGQPASSTGVSATPPPPPLLGSSGASSSGGALQSADPSGAPCSLHASSSAAVLGLSAAAALLAACFF